jgi:hypothetical protein
LRDLSDFVFRFSVEGNAVPLKNSKGAVVRGGKPTVIPNPKAKRYLERLACSLRADWYSVFRVPLPKGVFLNAAIVTYLPDGKRKDADNLYAAPGDALQTCRPKCKEGCRKHAGIITDDWWIRTHNGSDRLIDKARPRVEITLTPYDPGRAVLFPAQEEIEF